MTRTLLTRRWLLRLALALLVLVVLTWLGFWQLGVAYSKGRAEAVARQASEPERRLGEVLQPHQAFPDGGMNRPVRVTGRYEPEHQMLVPDRRLNGRDGYWVIAPLVVDGTGARLVVVRGFVTDPAQATRPAAQQVDLHATLAQPEGQPQRFDVPEDQIASVDPGSLLNRWGGSIYNAFVFAQTETPDTAAGTQVQRVPPPRLATGGVNWRNFFYALQWWVFGLVVVYVFLRVLREEAAGERTVAGGTEPAVPARPDPPSRPEET